MAQKHIDRLQKQRVNVDRRVTIAITMGGWLVLVTLLMLIWHLISVTQPILEKPTLTFERQLFHSSVSSPDLITRLNDRFYFFKQTDECEIEIFEALDNLEESATKGRQIDKIAVTGLESSVSSRAGLANRLMKNSLVTPPIEICSNDQKLVTYKQNSYLVQISQQGILRVFRFDQVENGFSQQIFSVRIPDFAVLRDSPALSDSDFLQQWSVSITDEALSLLIYSGTQQRFYKYGLASRQIVVDATLPVKNADSPLALVLNNNLNLLYAEQKLYLLTDEVDSLWRIFRTQETHDILDVVSLSTHHSVLLIDEELNLEKWSIINVDGKKVLEKLYSLKLEGETFVEMNHVSGDLVTLVIDDDVIFINGTTGEILNIDNLGTSYNAVHFIEQQMVFESPNSYQLMTIKDPTATITQQSLWGKVWYDGYPQPDYVWQTSSASDDMQAKYSVLPILMGSIKAAFLALVVAIPLAIGSAIYTGYYAGAGIRKIVKPYIEVLEAIPSVVIGFIAAIWLLPVSENYLVGVFLFLLLCPLFLLAFAWLNESKRHLNLPGWELLFFGGIIIVFLVIFQLIIEHNPQFLPLILGAGADGQMRIEIRNTFVLALALGIAIVPTVFTIAEDAIYQVPKTMPLASFALGATRSQTLLKIVIKVALPGIISAVMLGFARAVGETMIVLMVSGNTPIADWGIFEGIRTMTANLAIELPETQPDSVHYQILFFVALLLFGFTFVFNTMAELLRIKLRGRYKL